MTSSIRSAGSPRGRAVHGWPLRPGRRAVRRPGTPPARPMGVRTAARMWASVKRTSRFSKESFNPADVICSLGIALTGLQWAAKLRPRNGSGQVAEWLKAPPWKGGIRVTVSRVRIPPCPSPAFRDPLSPTFHALLTPRSGQFGRVSLYPQVTGTPHHRLPRCSAGEGSRRIRLSSRTTIGRYRVTRQLGEGGMGVVYAAHDDRLDRPVAIKRIREASDDASLRERLLREARAAASISHPNICHVYELAEEAGELYLVMELLSGEPLSERIAREPVPLAEALQITPRRARGARGAAQPRHRPPRPQAVERLPHAPRREAAGLRPRPPAGGAAQDGRHPHPARHHRRHAALHAAGTMGGRGVRSRLGPVRRRRDPVRDARGQAGVPGSTIIEVYRAVAMAQPPALSGGPEVVAADRIIQLALAKRPGDRYPDAAAMAREVRAAWALIDTGASPQGAGDDPADRAAVPGAATRSRDRLPGVQPAGGDHRLAVGPGCAGGPVHRGRAAIRRESPDLKAIATEAGVDVVLIGTLAAGGRSGSRGYPDAGGARRARCSAPARRRCDSPTSSSSRTTWRARSWSRWPSRSRPATTGSSGRTSGERQGVRAVSPSQPPRRGTSNPSRLIAARDLYRRCLEEDPGFAPGWARLGRVYRVLGQVRLGGTARRASRWPSRRSGARWRSTPSCRSRTTSTPISRSRSRGGRPRRSCGCWSGSHRRGGSPSVRGPGGGVPVLRLAGGVARRRPPGPPDRSVDPDQRAVHLLGARRLPAGDTARRRGHPGHPQRRALDAGPEGGGARPACARR